MSTIYLFEGQGCFVPHAWPQLQHHPVVQELCCLAERATSVPVASVCWGNNGAKATRDNSWLQVVMLTLNVAMARVFEATNGAPGIVTGHSLGELCAAIYAGACSFEQGCRVLQQRGVLMAQAAAGRPSDMLAIFCSDRAYIEACCRELSSPGHVVQMSNVNSSNEYIVAGDIAALNALQTRVAQERTYRIRRLAIGIGCHSAALEHANQIFTAVLAQQTWQPLRTPLYSATLGRVITTPQDIATMWQIHMLSTVEWTQAMLHLHEQFSDAQFLEIGPGNVLKHLMRHILPASPVRTWRDVAQAMK